MSIVKITNKQYLDELIAKITLRLGRKPTQQEILDHCVRLGQDHFDELIQRINPSPIFDDKKLQDIIDMREKLSKIKWYPAERDNFINEEDADIYTA
ncbi:hypothetical protein DSAG12_03035 [Promethearchaeum syntrophicum]|uniref:Uncharacterized protein n=1 Tax=Promethearchaeum syntrophicum TaxID=2594042 RepID=A0A5B9DEK5_9ARCH|nr:hypothetical protein [Candidatus Prometheoarchaeum syntrophicum]QEE17203.1 hypothetical protein DSAG12_03035 [Candidatus Prometheoarchaeum syntrophicum]